LPFLAIHATTLVRSPSWEHPGNVAAVLALAAPAIAAGLHHPVGLQPSLWLPRPVHHSLAERHSVCAFPWSHRASGKSSPRPPARLSATCSSVTGTSGASHEVSAPSALAGSACVIRSGQLRMIPLRPWASVRPTAWSLRCFACEPAARKPGHTDGHSKGSACRGRASGGSSGRATDHSPPLAYAGAAFRIVLASLSKTWPGFSGRPGGAPGVCSPSQL